MFHFIRKFFTAGSEKKLQLILQYQVQLGIDKTLFFHFHFPTKSSYDLKLQIWDTHWESQFLTGLVRVWKVHKNLSGTESHVRKLINIKAFSSGSEFHSHTYDIERTWSCIMRRKLLLENTEMMWDLCDWEHQSGSRPRQTRCAYHLPGCLSPISHCTRLDGGLPNQEDSQAGWKRSEIIHQRMTILASS